MPTVRNTIASSPANRRLSSSSPPFDSSSSFTALASLPRGIGGLSPLAGGLFFFPPFPLIFGTASSGSTTSVLNRRYAAAASGTTRSGGLAASAYDSICATRAGGSPSRNPHFFSSSVRRSRSRFCTFSRVSSSRIVFATASSTSASRSQPRSSSTARFT
ncbi:hypothetical protein GSI_07032 [Ganoderma sinense ZZ0214-1]|uniref:Uncharacterized protein n=1 Tax=Ganoderma sinense ZZ0214-1 TaxID=1077348 RepID=A0A2G8SAV3_9APHY|nr:hypothetical protein GSI_07032 [Ganoderma sinense ZZ0214-1]